MCPEFDKRYTSKRWATFNYNSSKTSGLGMTGAKSEEKKENKLLFKLFCCQICTQEGIHFSYRKNTENCILANPSRSAHMTGTCITFFCLRDICYSARLTIYLCFSAQNFSFCGFVKDWILSLK